MSIRDVQSLAYLVVQPALALWQWRHGFSPLAYGLMLFLAVGVSAIHHNHTHLPMWKTRRANAATDFWLALLQGHPGFVFFPTHIGNHHRHKHGERDVARTYRFGGDRNDLLGCLLHPLQAFPILFPVIMDWFWKVRGRAPKLFRHCVAQFVVPGVSWMVLGSIDPGKLLTYVWLPQLYGVHWLLATNYLQHAHADGRGGMDYARNFEGWVNTLLFNIGLHTAHHEHPRAHWSDLSLLHKRYRSRVHPQLLEPSFGRYVLRVYFGALIASRYRSRPLMAPASVPGS